MSKRTLNGRWQLACAEPGEGETAGWPENGTPQDRRVEARVPGDVHLDLIEAGLIDEPLHGRNAPDCQWMETRDWWHARSFHVSPDLAGQRVELHFAGLDLTADVWLNGVPVGHAENAFVPHDFDVTDAVRPGSNLLVVRLDCGLRAVEGRELERYALTGGPQPRVWMRKPQFVFGWDWAPRLATCGIWRAVELRSYDALALRDVCLRSSLEAGSARVEVLAEVENFTSSPMDATVEVVLERGAAHSVTIQQPVGPGRQTLTGQLVIEAPDLWWPRPLGEPALYDVEATLSAEGAPLDRLGFRCGIREVELIQEPLEDGEGTSFVIAVNGEKVFCKGANWVPADSIIARVSPARYRALVSAAAEANFNMLRIWGGGIYEDDAFYDLCDEHGILVWQDFPFACAYYPDDDEAFVAAVEDESRKAIIRLRNHPCIALWCGNNENQWIHYQRRPSGGGAERCFGERLYDELLPDLCARLDPTRPYWPSSPYGGEDPNSELLGDRHAWNISIGAPTVAERVDYTRYALDRGKFISEFGIIAPPSLDSLRRCLPPEEFARDSESWAFHTNRFEKGTLGEALKRYWRPAEELSLDDYVRFGQMIQAEALKFSLEHWRRRKFRTAGALFWMYADCWGEAGWTVIDYYLNRKPSYYAVKRAFAPALVSLAAAGEGVEVWLVNDLLDGCSGKLTCGWLDLRTGAVEQQEQGAEAPPNGAACVARLAPREGAPERWMAFARFEREGRLVSSNRLFLAGFEFNKLPLAPARVDCRLAADGGALELTTDNFAWGVHLEAPRGVWLEDNDLDLLPGETRIVAVRGPETLLERIQALPLNDAVTLRDRSASAPPVG